jgi:flagellar basal-body rod protein FlgC
MSLFDVINTSATGMVASRFWLDTIAGNIANANSTRTAEGGPFRRRMPVFQEAVQDALQGMDDDFSERSDKSLAQSITAAVMDDMQDPSTYKSKGEGVKMKGVVEDPSPLRVVYMPGHPDADQEGYVSLPNVSVVKEMVDMIAAQRAYDANVQITNAAKSMINKALEIGK